MKCEMCEKDCNKQYEITIEVTLKYMDVKYLYKVCDKCVNILLGLLKKPERIK